MTLQRGLGIAAEDRQHERGVEALAVDASTGPRHCCRGSAVAPSLRVGGRVASTGPRHCCRGSSSSGRTARTPVPALQRGLGIAAEDRACGRARASWCRRFNGASALLPRIGVYAARSKVVGEIASTGPRHCCRGSRSTARSATTRRRMLQRGLGIAAEDRPMLDRLVVRVVGASTGPRHCCRGSAHARSALRRARRASTGPRHCCRGSERGGQSRADRRGVASTGPRHCCRGSDP